jgi:hypothetical protein
VPVGQKLLPAVVMCHFVQKHQEPVPHSCKERTLRNWFHVTVWVSSCACARICECFVSWHSEETDNTFILMFWCCWFSGEACHCLHCGVLCAMYLVVLWLNGMKFSACHTFGWNIEPVEQFVKLRSWFSGMWHHVVW